MLVTRIEPRGRMLKSWHYRIHNFSLFLCYLASSSYSFPKHIIKQINPLYMHTVIRTNLTNNSSHLLSYTQFSRNLFGMGMILGKISVETPKFEAMAATNDYEIRKYPPSVVAEVTYDPAQFNSNKDGGFMILANYIGALGNPQNTKPEKIAMTAPVITKTASEKISMTAPVVTKGGGDLVTMGFILPSKYVRAEDAPRPLDERVVIREEGEKKYGVVRFSGVARDGVVAEKVEELRKCLERDGYKVAGDFVLARYNPPWTLPPFRTNEVMIPVE